MLSDLQHFASIWDHLKEILLQNFDSHVMFYNISVIFTTFKTFLINQHSKITALPPHYFSSLHQATVNMFYYQRQHSETVPLGYQNLELTCRSLEPGEPYLLYILSKRRPEQPPQTFTFQDYVPQCKGFVN